MKSKITICVVLLIITIASMGCTAKQDRSQQDSLQLNDTHKESAGDFRDIEGTWMGN
jgi:hypothetical protein